MREIKFRVWTGRKMWTPIRAWDFAHGDIELGKNESGNHFSSDHYHSEGDANIMQFTGLRDRNGADIYEGDIVMPDKNPKGNPEYYFCPYEIVYDAHKYILRRKSGQQLSGGILHNKSVEWELIGNIWENPGLLQNRCLHPVQQCNGKGQRSDYTHLVCSCECERCLSTPSN